MRILLSYNATDAWLTEAFRASLYTFGPEMNFVLSPESCSESSRRHSGSLNIRGFDALLLVAGPSGLSAAQKTEWRAAAERAVGDNKFVLLPVLAGQSQPPHKVGLPIREWFEAPVVTDRDMVQKLIRLLKNCEL